MFGNDFGYYFAMFRTATLVTLRNLTIEACTGALTGNAGTAFDTEHVIREIMRGLATGTMSGYSSSDAEALAKMADLLHSCGEYGGGSGEPDPLFADTLRQRINAL